MLLVLRVAFCALVGFTVSPALSEPKPGPWQIWAGCRLAESSFNDGDSFHIKHAGQERIIRLYFVDTPETRDLSDFKQRLTEQARYWKINRGELYRVADAAKAFTHQKLSQPFTVYTRLEDARGNSRSPRYFGFVETSEGDLAELLVGAGLARIYGYHVDHPNGTNAKRYRAALEAAETTAKKEQLGAWEIAAAKGRAPKPSATPKAAPSASKKPTPKSKAIPSNPSLDEIPAF